MARSHTAADQLVERLVEWGIDTVFGLPGDGINGVMESLRTHADQIRFVHVRHEETAALAACAYGKFTGRPAACLATAAPGAVHLPRVRDASPHTLVMTDGFSCRSQIEHGSERGALHLAQVVQMALREGPNGPSTPRPEQRYARLPR